MKIIIEPQTLEEAQVLAETLELRIATLKGISRLINATEQERTDTLRTIEVLQGMRDRMVQS